MITAFALIIATLGLWSNSIALFSLSLAIMLAQAGILVWRRQHTRTAIGYVSSAVALMLVIFYIIPGFYQLTFDYPKYGSLISFISIVYVITFYALNNLAYAQFTPKRQSTVYPSNPHDHSMSTVYILCILGMALNANLVLSIFGPGTLGRQAFVDDGLRNINDFGGFVGTLASAVTLIVGTYIIVFSSTKSTFSSSVTLVVGVAICSAPALGTGTRSLAVIPLFAYIFRALLAPRQNSPNTRNVAIMVFIALIFIVYTTLERSESTNVLQSFIDAFLGSTNFFIELERSIELTLSVGPLQESQLAAFASALVPRFLWQDKPISMVTELVTIDAWGYYAEIGGGNVLAGLLGQFVLGEGFVYAILSMYLLLCAFYTAGTLLATIVSRTKNITIRRLAHLDLFFLLIGIILSGRFLALYNFLPFIMIASLLAVLRTRS